MDLLPLVALLALVCIVAVLSLWPEPAPIARSDAVNPLLSLLSGGMDPLTSFQFGGAITGPLRRNWKRKTRRYRHT
jgi:hypothetical protein